MIFLQSIFLTCDIYFRLVLSHFSISYSFRKCESLLIMITWRSCQQVCMVSHLWEIRECCCAKRLFPHRGLIYHHCSASRTKIDTYKTWYFAHCLLKYGCFQEKGWIVPAIFHPYIDCSQKYKHRSYFPLYIQWGTHTCFYLVSYREFFDVHVGWKNRERCICRNPMPAFLFCHSFWERFYLLGKVY